jgi:hypothetical protein
MEADQQCRSCAAPDGKAAQTGRDRRVFGDQKRVGILEPCVERRRHTPQDHIFIERQDVVIGADLTRANFPATQLRPHCPSRFPVRRGRESGRQAERRRDWLHWAAFGAHGDAVKQLPEHGARVGAIDRTYQGAPLGWALHDWFTSSGKSLSRSNSLLVRAAQSQIRSGSMLTQCGAFWRRRFALTRPCQAALRGEMPQGSKYLRTGGGRSPVTGLVYDHPLCLDRRKSVTGAYNNHPRVVGKWRVCLSRPTE